MITIEDVRKLALPLGSTILNGEGQLNRPISWATVVQAEGTPPSSCPQPDELIIIGAPQNSSAYGPSILPIVRWASGCHAAALVFCGQVSTTVIAEARASQLPVFQLPAGSRVRDIERTVISLLVDRQGQLERRGTQIYRQLTEISARNEGMAELINTMARLTGKAVILQDKRLRTLASNVQPQYVMLWDEIEAFVKQVKHLPVEFQDRLKVQSSDHDVLLQSLPIPGYARLVAPVITSGIGRGYLSVIGTDEQIDDVDALVAEHGAGACALEMAKQKAVSETEKRLRGTFLDRVLLGDVGQQEAIQQGERFEHDMTQTHIAIVLRWRGQKDNPSLRRLETIVNAVVALHRTSALVWQREKENEIVVFHATDAKDPVDTSLRLANRLIEEAETQVVGQQIAVGIGQPARDISTWRSTYRDAVQAMELANRLQTETALYIGDLGVYQLILSLSEREKLIHFCEGTLGPILEYDLRNNADLIKTLEAFFNAHGNLSQTAEALIVHRNTLLYRMRRINEIAEIDMERPETRLALHLALTIRRLLATR
jgi:PucR family transcriptional regulator, purine catabolism regulatory protein